MNVEKASLNLLMMEAQVIRVFCRMRRYFS